jgi:hypothetical protein
MTVPVKLVTSAYYNIEGYPHYGAGRRHRLLKSLPNIAENTQLPIVCYTSKKYGCYEELTDILTKRNITNVTLKVRELEEHPLHDTVLEIRKSNELLNVHYQHKPIIVYWSKFDLLLEELDFDGYVYWIDGGLSHNGMFPKRFSVGDTSAFGTTDSNATYNFSCFNADSFQRISKFTEPDKVLHMVRPAIDADVATVVTIPKLENKFSNANGYWPVGGFFGGHAKTSPLRQYIEKFIEVSTDVVEHKRLTVEEGIMAYIDVIYQQWFKRYHFDNFYTEDEQSPFLHIGPNGEIYHHFYRMFCDECDLIDSKQNK